MADKFLTIPFLADEGKGFTDNGDGTVTVYGKLTDGRVDLDEQIVDQKWAAKALRQWFDEWGNIRQMHDGIAVGTATKLEEKADGIYLEGCIVDDRAVKLVKHGVLKAWSIGMVDITVIPDPRARGGRITDGIVNESSIVDFPANLGTKFSIVKRAKDGTITHDELWVDPELLLNVDALDGESVVKAVLAAHGKAELTTEARGNLNDSDFGYIDAEGERHLPIHDAAHVRAALARFGQTHFDTPADKKAAAKKIIAKATQLGIDVSDDADVSQAASKAATNDKEPIVDCETCKGTGKIMDGNRTCPDCNGTGKATPKGKEAETEEGKGKVPEVDQEVTDALDKTDDDLNDAKDAQARDNGAHEAGNDDDDDDGADNDDDKKKGKKDKGKKDAGETPFSVKRLHDLVCPVFSSEALAQTYPIFEENIKAVIDVDVLHKGLKDALKKDADPQTVLFQAQAFAAAAKLATLTPPEMRAMHDVAFKAFNSAYPDVKVSPVDSIMPAQFQRGFLSGSNPEEAKPGQNPRIPDSHPLEASSFQRGPLPASQSTPNVPGAIRPVQTAGKSAREFYTNSAKDEAAGMAATLHDYVSAHHPDVCPMHGASDAHGDGDDPNRDESRPDLAIDGPANTQSQGLDPVSSLDAKPSDTLAAVGKASGADDAPQALLADAVKRIEQVQEENTRLRAEVKLFGSRVDELESRGDPAERAFRGTSPLQFGKGATSDKTARKAKKVQRKAARIADAIKRANSPVPDVREAGVTDLRGLLSPQDFAKVAVDKLSRRN